MILLKVSKYICRIVVVWIKSGDIGVRNSMNTVLEIGMVPHGDDVFPVEYSWD